MAALGAAPSSVYAADGFPAICKIGDIAPAARAPLPVRRAGARQSTVSASGTVSTVQVHNTSVSGPVKLLGGGGVNPIIGPGVNFNDLEDDHIGGPVTETAYHGIWAGILRNVVGGPLTFSNNSEAPTIDEYDIGSNTVYGPLTCDGNDPAPNKGGSPGGPNTVYGPIRGDQGGTCAA